jgi:hypothetical protein
MKTAVMRDRLTHTLDVPVYYIVLMQIFLVSLDQRSIKVTR